MATASEPTEAVEKVGEEVTEAMDQIGEETAEAMEQVGEDTAEAIEQVGEETTETKELGGEKPNEAMEQQIGEEQEDSLRSALPLGMVKRIIRADRDIKKVTSEAAAMLITAANELFVSILTAGRRSRGRGYMLYIYIYYICVCVIYIYIYVIYCTLLGFYLSFNYCRWLA
jgi:DNA-directed RNA polymerase I subunit RPA43